MDSPVDEVSALAKTSQSKKAKAKAVKRPKPTSQAVSEAVAEAKSAKAAPNRRVNRFNGMTEEEVALRGLPDYLREGLDIVFIGINPSLAAAYSGKYYDGPGNHFWRALFLSGLIDQPLGPQDDYKLMDLGIGFTNVCPRTTRGVADLSKAEIAAGAVVLKEKLLKYRPKIAVFNGKSIYQVYSESKKFMFGRQPAPLDHEGGRTWIWVMPSSSARCAQLPRAVDKVPFFSALIKFRDFLHGKTAEPDEADIVFANVVLKNAPRRPKVKVEHEEPPAEDSM